MWKMHLWKLQVPFSKSSTWEKNKSTINIPTRVPNTEIINSFAINKNGFLYLSIEFGTNLILLNKPSNKFTVLILTIKYRTILKITSIKM